MPWLSRDLPPKPKNESSLGTECAIGGQANQSFHLTNMADYGIDGETGFRGKNGKASVKRTYV